MTNVHRRIRRSLLRFIAKPHKYAVHIEHIPHITPPHFLLFSNQGSHNPQAHALCWNISWTVMSDLSGDRVSSSIASIGDRPRAILPTSNTSSATQIATPTSECAVSTEKRMHWNDPSNVLNPFNWVEAKKWRTTLLACFMTFIIQLNGTMMTSAAEQINVSFNVSDEKFPHSYWPVLSWNLGGAAAPMLGLPLMENFGVRRSYMVGRQ